MYHIKNLLWLIFIIRVHPCRFTPDITRRTGLSLPAVSIPCKDKEWAVTGSCALSSSWSFLSLSFPPLRGYWAFFFK